MHSLIRGWRRRRIRPIPQAIRKGYTLVHIPNAIANEIGLTSAKAGIPKELAIATALYSFARCFSTEEKVALIRSYQETVWSETT